MAALCAATFFARGQSHPPLTLHGADPSREDAVGRAVSALVPLSEDDAAVASAILSVYRAFGYYRTNVDSVKADSGSVEVWLSEGKPTIVDTLRITGVTGEVREALRNAIVLREGELFVERTLEQDVQSVLGAMEARGFLDVRVEVSELREAEGDEEFRLSFDIDVRPGAIAAIDSAVFRGLDVTTPRTAQLLSGLWAGEPWSSRTADAARRRLSRSGIFRNVSGPELFMTGPARVKAIFTVTEGRPNSFDGVIGYLPPPPGSETGTITGLVDLHFRNLFGTARQLHARWYQERQSRHEIEVGYREPAIAGWLVSGEAGLFQRRQDSTYVRLDVSLAFDAEVGMDMFAGLTLSTSTTTPVEGYGLSVLPKSDAQFVGTRFAYDTRDRPVTTRSGVLYATSLQAGRKSWSFNGISTVSGMQRLSFDAEFYYPTFAFQSLVLTARWRQVTGNGTDESDLYRLGGSTNLRGYRENEFSGSRIIWQTTEYRFFLSPASYIGGFVDLASIYVGAVAGTVAPRDLFRAGYGITSLIETPIGGVGLSIAMGEGDGIGDAKLHVRLRTEF